jgi:flagellar motor protein MotB
VSQFNAPVKRETTQKQKVGFAVLGGVGAVVLGVMVYLLAFAPLPEAEVNCSPTPNVRTDAQVETSVVVAPTANFTDIELPLEIAKQRLVPALSDPTLINTLSVVVANDNPRKGRDLVIVQEPGEVIQDFEEKLDRAPGVVRLAVNCALEQPNPGVGPETNLLKAIGVAADTFLNDSSEKTIYVLSNGLQTSGEIDMTSDMPQTEAQAKSLAKQLEQSNALPDLQGVSVEWFGMGSIQSTSKQSVINEQTIKVLDAFWTEVIKLSGGELTERINEVGYKAPPANAYQTSAVSSLPTSCLITLNEDDGVRFNPGVTTFVNEAKAKKAAEAVVAELNDNDCVGEIKVTGFVASGVDKDKYDDAEIESGQQLSLARAKAFAALIKAAGWNGKINAIGGGKGSVDDWNADGTFNETKGKSNRKVVISQ